MVNPYNIVKKYQQVMKLLEELVDYVITFDSAKKSYFCGICGYVGHSFKDGRIKFAHSEDCEATTAQKLIEEYKNG